jgi:NADPH-dependent 2,4-dienoyl-CoA reductase/sulfur reductase-like enzyme
VPMLERACDIAVIGAGPAGLTAAAVAASHGKRVVLLDENPAAGGQIWRGERNFAVDDVETMFETRAIGLASAGVLLCENAERAISLPFRKLIIATGARERFLPFPGWTLPGVFGAGGLQAMVKSGFPVEGKRLVMAGTGPLLMEAARYLRSRGARIAIVAEQAPWTSLLRFGLALRREPAKWTQAMRLASEVGTLLRAGRWVSEVSGTDHVECATLTDGRRTWRVACDYVACGFHLVPNVEMAAVLGCRIENGFVWTDGLQKTNVRDIYCAGEPCGIGGVEKSIVEGGIAGHAAAGGPPVTTLLEKRCRARLFQAALDGATRLRPELSRMAREDTIVCRCEDVPLARIRECADWRSAKLLTRCGMGACQGRVCGSAVETLFGWRADSVRPPVLPARAGTLANWCVEARKTR